MTCSECNKPIEDGMQITVYKSHFHTDCAIAVVKKARETNESDDSRRNESHEGRTGDLANAFVN